MKQKSDESPDQWVRQTLSQLPDAPPPGSSFNPDQLWAKLRPELQPVSSTRPQARSLWWLAAACVAALSVGWLWLTHQSASEPTVAVAHKTYPRTQIPVQERSGSTRADAPDRLKRAVSGVERPRVALRTHIAQKTKLEIVTMAPVATSAALPTPDDVLTLAEAPAVIDLLPALPRPKVAGSQPKRRFQVVHENELRAEEEAQPKLYRPDHFVRLGTGQSEEPRPEASRPALLMSLTNKPNH